MDRGSVAGTCGCDVWLVTVPAYLRQITHCCGLRLTLEGARYFRIRFRQQRKNPRPCKQNASYLTLF
jgi:hypothetical protein